MDDYSKDVKIFKALCDEKRLAILNHLKSGENSLSKSGSEYASRRLLELTTPGSEKQSKYC